jgi:hypothetical protein
LRGHKNPPTFLRGHKNPPTFLRGHKNPPTFLRGIKKKFAWSLENPGFGFEKPNTKFK